MDPTGASPSDPAPVGHPRTPRLSTDARILLGLGALMTPLAVLLGWRAAVALTDWMDAEISKMAAAKWD